MQRQRMAAVEGADVELGHREFGIDQFDDAVGGGAVVDADGDDLGRAGAGSAQHIEPRAVAVVDLEAEAPRHPDHLGVGIDDRHVHLAGQQHLARDLAEAAEADDQSRAAEAVRDLDAVHGRCFLAEQELQGERRERRQRHRHDHGGGEEPRGLVRGCRSPPRRR